MTPQNCAFDGCKNSATTVAGVVFGSFRLGPIEVPVCDEHLENLTRDMAKDVSFVDLRGEQN